MIHHGCLAANTQGRIGLSHRIDTTDSGGSARNWGLRKMGWTPQDCGRRSGASSTGSPHGFCNQSKVGCQASRNLSMHKYIGEPRPSSFLLVRSLAARLTIKAASLSLVTPDRRGASGFGTHCNASMIVGTTALVMWNSEEWTSPKAALRKPLKSVCRCLNILSLISQPNSDIMTFFHAVTCR